MYAVSSKSGSEPCRVLGDWHGMTHYPYFSLFSVDTFNKQFYIISDIYNKDKNKNNLTE